MSKSITSLVVAIAIVASTSTLRGEKKGKTDAASRQAAKLGLVWLANNQGKEGNWEARDLALVSIGALAFMSAGNTPKAGPYKDNVRRALDYVLANAKPSGMLNIAGEKRDMYNHGLTTFVLTQAYGMSKDKRLAIALRKAVKIIVDAQCDDGGWDYQSVRRAKGHDLSLAVIQTRALHYAMKTNIGIQVPKYTLTKASKVIQGYYRCGRKKVDNLAKKHGWTRKEAEYPGLFTYNGGMGTTAMAAAGAVCIQELDPGNYRVFRSANWILSDIKKRMKIEPGKTPFDAYTMYYVSQALYLVAGEVCQDGYPLICKALVKTQALKSRGSSADDHGSWKTRRVGGKPGQMFGTAAAVLALNIPDRLLPFIKDGRGARDEKKPSPSTLPSAKRKP